MPKVNRRAGQNIRELALKRRFKAILSFASAGLVIFFPIFWTKIFQTFLGQLPHPTSSQGQHSFSFPPIFYVMFVLIALLFVGNGVFLWKRANHADQGARGEEVISQKMLQLQQEGWQVEYGMRLGNRLGDADIVCISPRNKAYVIDVKSHKGEVTTDGKQLYRCRGNSNLPFEKDFLVQAVKQALQVKKQKNLNFVTPIVVFSDAKVSVPTGKLQKVYVVEKSRLVPLLKSLG